MYKENPALFYTILCIGIFLIIALNVSLFSWVRNNSLQRQIKMTKTMMRKVQSPWEDEDQELQKLSDIVDSLKDDKPKTD